MAVPNGSTVRWFHSDMADAPEVRNVAGGLIDVLDACLINGFGQKVVDSISVSGGVATVNISSGHDYEKHAVIRLSGSSIAALNDDWRVTGATGASLTFNCPGVADGFDPGPVSVIRATPGWWEKPFGATGARGAYRSTHPNASGLFLYIDDSPTGTNASRVRGYETMSTIDDGENPFPTFEQEANMVWRRTSTITASLLPRPWVLVADESFMWLFMNWHSALANRAAMYQFGDIVPIMQDAFHCVLTAHSISIPTAPGSNTSQNNFGGDSTGSYFARDMSDAAPGPVGYGRVGSRITSNPGGGEIYPARVNNGYIFFYPVAAYSNGQFRGNVPGIIQSLTSSVETIPPDVGLEVVRVFVEPTDVTQFTVLLLGVAAGDSMVSHCGINISGPWR